MKNSCSPTPRRRPAAFIVRYTLMTIAILCSTHLLAQTTAPPVTAVVQTLPPFTANLSDWADPVNDKIGVTLLLNDRAEPGYQVQLRLTIEGQGIRLQTSPDWSPTPIPLSYGIPTQLSGPDLLEYFDLDHLLFSGLSKEQYLARGGLPEGSYSICVEVYDVVRDGEQAGGRRACSFVQARLLDPPVILSPIGQQVSIAPQMLLLQWQARHSAAFITDYRVEVYETEVGLSPEQIFALQQPYLEAEVSGMTSLLIDASYPALRRGATYFLRVQARPPQGGGVFKNGGYSELSFFTYGEACAPPEGLNATVERFDRARLRWDFKAGSGSYVVRYRVKNPDANWYEESTPLNFLVLDDLNDSTTYEVQLQAVCDDVVGATGPIFEFTTPGIPFSPDPTNCGDEIIASTPPVNTQPVTNLGFGARVRVGRFTMQVIEATRGAGGTWDGTGLIRVPWLGAKINCTFRELGVNTELSVFSGEVVAVDEGLASLSDLMAPGEVSQDLGETTVDFCGNTLAPPAERAAATSFLERLGPANLAENTTTASPDGGSNLPIVLGRDAEQIAFYGMRFNAGGASMSAYTSARLPVGNRLVAFGAQNFAFQPGGMAGDSRLALLTELDFSWNDKMKFTLGGSENTYVAFDCEGLTEIGLSMEVALCRELVVPVDPITAEARADGYVTATFAGVARTWNDFAGEVSLSPFELPTLPGWTFTAESAVLDFSDGGTPESVTFPEGFTHPDVTAGGGTGSASPAWKGFYLGLARVRVPERFTGGSREADQALSIGASQLLIDQTGFTGSVFGTNILTLEEGRAGTWAMALDSVAITVQHGQFESTNLTGQIEIPALDAPLAYNCHIQPGGTYAFAVALSDTLSMSAMVASVSLFENTEITVEYDEASGEFVAGAALYGQASFAPSLGGESGNNAGSSGSKMELPGIAFEGFELSSQSPYIISPGSWSLAGGGEQPAAGGFPLQLNEVSMLHDESRNQVALGIGLTLNLVGEDDKGFGAEGRGFIICDVSVNPATNKQEWSFNRVRLDRLSLDYVGAAFELHGFLRLFEEDPVYGTGFTGGIQAIFTPGISVGAMALFGKKNDYRYFFADAKVELNPGIALGQSGMAIFGFGGGVSYHMDRLGFDRMAAPVSAATDTGADASAEEVPSGNATANTDLASALESGDPAASLPSPVDIPDELGVSLSGVRYVPDRGKSIGIKAMVAFGTVSREVFNGDLTLEVLFNNEGGMDKIALTGNANFLTPPKTAANPRPQAAISALADLVYDFENEAFDAYLRLTVYAGEGIVQGAYPNAVAGEGKIHASESEWYIYLGTPTQPIKISYDPSALANVAGDALPRRGANPHETNATGQTPRDQPLGSIGNVGITFSAYLDAGTRLPPFPPPPSQVREILGYSGNDAITDRDDPSFANASGLLFGAGFDVSMPDLEFLIFYASIEAGLGFDMMMKNYGTSAACANLADSPSPIGLNGWYGTGQIYGYLTADVGIEVDLLGFEGRYSILEVGVAALLQARLPNPIWMKGELAGEYSILGGLVSGSCEFEFEAGTECNISPVGNLAAIEIIQSLTPDNQATDVSVFTNPQALFNFGIDREIPIEEPGNPSAAIKPVLREFTVSDLTSGATIPGELEWNEGRTVVAFRPSDILPGQRRMRLVAIVDVLRGNGFTGWQQAIANGRPVSQRLEYTFTTGEAPDYIPEENVRYAYPIHEQLNFHRLESGQGYVQLNKGQAYLFMGQPENTLDPAKWRQEIRFSQNGRTVTTVPFTYDAGENRLSFSVPGGQLTDGRISRYQILNVPRVENTSVDANVEEVNRDLAANYPGGIPDANTTSVVLRSREASGSLTALKEKEIYRLDFRTSQYATFPAQAAAFVELFPYVNPQALSAAPAPVTREDGTVFQGPYLSIDDFGRIASLSEALDVFDLEGQSLGGKDIRPLIRAEANLAVTAQNWYRANIAPNLYDQFPRPAAGFPMTWREETVYGAPPSRAIKVRQRQAGLPPSLGQEVNFPATGQGILLAYHLPWVMYKDYVEYWNQLMNRATGSLTPRQEAFLEWNFTYPKRGAYEIQLQYFLPGASTPNSTFTTQLNY